MSFIREEVIKILINKKSNMTFDSLMYEWLDFHSLSVSEHTIYNRQKTIKQLCKQFDVSDVKIKNITSDYIQQIIFQLSERGLSTATLKDYTKVLRMSLQYAVSKEYIKESPYHSIIVPKKPTKDINPFEEEEVKKLLSVKAAQWFLDACELSFRTGMRKGEIFALEKDDINFNHAFIMVRKTQSMDRNGKVILKEPKTKASKRRIDCDEATMEILSRRCNDSSSSFIFAYDDGRMFVPWGLSHMLKSKSKIAKIGQHRFHDLRHGHATYLLIQNVHPKIVQERLGHTNVGITLDTYSHLVPGLQQTAVYATSKMNI